MSKELEKTITISMGYGDSLKSVIIALESEEEMDSSDVYLALCQWIEEFEKEVYSTSDKDTVH